MYLNIYPSSFIVYFETNQMLKYTFHITLVQILELFTLKSCTKTDRQLIFLTPTTLNNPDKTGFS